MTATTPDELRALASDLRADDGYALNHQRALRAADALEQAASDRAALDRLRATVYKAADAWDVERGESHGSFGRLLWFLQEAIRDEQDGGAERTDWVDDAAPLPRPERNDE